MVLAAEPHFVQCGAKGTGKASVFLAFVGWAWVLEVLGCLGGWCLARWCVDVELLWYFICIG